MFGVSCDLGLGFVGKIEDRLNKKISVKNFFDFDWESDDFFDEFSFFKIKSVFFEI